MDASARVLSAALCLVLGSSMMGAEKVHDIQDYGAKPGGKELCTAAIQKAIDACAAGGGGTVRIPPGTFLSGALILRSKVALLVDEGATLLGSTQRADYYGPPLDAQGRPTDGEPVFRNLIHGERLRDVAIRGKGTIDGSGAAFRTRKQKRPKNIYLANCRNVTIEDLQLRDAGCWMQHYRRCRDLTLRNLTVFNHAAFNNDGMNIDSCRDVTVTSCRVDSDDDGIVLKSLSPEPCRDVRIADCTVSSHCNALKMGTESGGGFVDIAIERCTVFSPKHSKSIYGRQRGLAGIALEIVDGGRLENVTVSDVDIQGVSVPIFLRLGNRARPYAKGAKPGVGTLRKVRLTNIRARGTSAIGCAIAGLPGHPIDDVVLANVSLGFEGGGSRDDARRAIPERPEAYPESTMFGTLPAYGLYCRHARGLTFRNLELRIAAPDLRHALVFDDVSGLAIDGFHAAFSPGAAPLIRMTDVQKATLRACSPKKKVDTLLRLEGKTTSGIVLKDSDTTNVGEVASISRDVPDGAFTQK